MWQVKGTNVLLIQVEEKKKNRLYGEDIFLFHDISSQKQITTQQSGYYYLL